VCVYLCAFGARARATERDTDTTIDTDTDMDHARRIRYVKQVVSTLQRAFPQLAELQNQSCSKLRNSESPQIMPENLSQIESLSGSRTDRFGPFREGGLYAP
jgi:hypothetical protein